MVSRLILFACFVFFKFNVTFGENCGAPTSTTSSTPIPLKTVVDDWSDPTSGGKLGNPGARIHLPNKTIDTLHKFASDVMCRAILDMVVSDFSLPIGMGSLSIKSPRMVEAEFGNVEYENSPPNRIRSRFSNGTFVGTGNWEWEAQGSFTSGTYKASIFNGQLESVTQLGRTYDAKPTIQMIQCQATLNQFDVQVDGAGSVTMQNCDNPFCYRIRRFVETAMCQLARTLVQEILNQELARYPPRVVLPSNPFVTRFYGQQNQLDYGLMGNEPKVTQCGVQAGLEGKYLWRGMGSIPFYPPEPQAIETNRTLSLELTDYTFNTLFHQAHAQGFRFSAADLLSTSQPIQDLLKMNCSFVQVATTPATRKGYRRGPMSPVVSSRSTSMNCLGSIFENITGSSVQYDPNDSGDLVFKSRKAPTVLIINSQRAYFDASNGILEVYGPQSMQDGRRQLLAKTDIRLMRGEFIPKLNGTNITSSIIVSNLQLVPYQPESRSMMRLEDIYETLAKFSMPVLTEMFNAFLQTFAQFPVPLPKGYVCSSPEFKINSRSIQIGCDIEISQQSLLKCSCMLLGCRCRAS